MSLAGRERALLFLQTRGSRCLRRDRKGDRESVSERPAAANEPRAFLPSVEGQLPARRHARDSVLERIAGRRPWERQQPERD